MSRQISRLPGSTGIKVLFTCSSPKRVGGIQSIIRDLASGLRRRGHETLVYGVGEPVDGDASAGIGTPMVWSLDALPFVPDIIHGHHHLVAMPAIMALPGVPALYSSHGATHGDRPPRHPRIYGYTAMSPTLRLRMATESGIDEGDIAVVCNTVDLERFSVRREPPERPRKALVYRRDFDPDSAVGREIREAADAAGLTLDFRGLGTKLRTVLFPEKDLPRYDLVFASGKSAIEALACGCAVIILGNTTCGELVRQSNFDRLRQGNFTPPVNSPPPASAAILGEIRGISAAEVGATSLRLRRVADARRQVDVFLGIYEKVIGIHKRTPPDLAAEQRAVFRYLRDLLPLVEPLDAPPEAQPIPQKRKAAFAALARQIAATIEPDPDA